MDRFRHRPAVDRASARSNWVLLGTWVFVTGIVVALMARELVDVIAANRLMGAELATLSSMRRPGEPQLLATGRGMANDFTHRLPVEGQAERLGAELQRACSATGVLINSMQLKHQLPSEVRLAHTEISLSLAGTYPKIMQAVGEALTRTPNATLRHMSLRRMPANAEVEASVVIEVWGQPSWPGTNLLNESR